MILTETQKIAHLLRRFGLGASEAEIIYYSKIGVKGTVNALLDFNRPDGFTLDSKDQTARNFNVRSAQTTWMNRLLITQTPLKEKLTLFWHDHFATSAQKVNSAAAMVQHIETLRTFGLSKFEELLLAMSQDPAMIFWLDNQLNMKDKPNENYGREVMELFSIGIGNYSEKDVQEVARAFTGWGYGNGARQVSTVPRNRNKFIFDQNRHDVGTKVILGNTGKWNGDEVCGLLAAHPATALNITKKMWEFFAYTNPEPALIERLAQNYRNNGLRGSVLVRSIMEAPEFYSEKCYRRQYKDPISFTVSTLRQLGLGANLNAEIEAANLETDEKLRARKITVASRASYGALQACKAMGLELMMPPDVAGWNWGTSWISSATMVERMKWSDRIFGSGGTKTPSMRLSVSNIGLDASSAPDLARRLAELFDCNMTEAKIQQLEAAATKAAAGNFARNQSKVAVSVCRLMFGAPEFQFS